MRESTGFIASAFKIRWLHRQGTKNAVKVFQKLRDGRRTERAAADPWHDTVLEEGRDEASASAHWYLVPVSSCGSRSIGTVDWRLFNGNCFVRSGRPDGTRVFC